MATEMWVKTSIREILDQMYKHNVEAGITSKGQDKSPVAALVLFKTSAFDVPLPAKKRLYRFTSDNKAFIPGQSSNSIFIERIYPDHEHPVFISDDFLKVYGFDPEMVEWAKIGVTL